MSEDIYPCVIFATRYGGVYEGGEWAAMVTYQVPGPAQSSDLTCIAWWEYWIKDPRVAVGTSPENAYQRLLTQQQGNSFPPELPPSARDFKLYPEDILLAACGHPGLGNLCDSCFEAEEATWD